MNEVGILTGGDSSEREVSLKTAEIIKKCLKENGTRFKVIDVSDKDWQKQVPSSVVIIALHGRFGEDGTLQNILEGLQIPFTGSGSQASKIAFDKIATKKIAQELGINCPENVSADSTGFPVVVKPNREGSSYGVTIVKDSSKMPEAIALAKQYGKDLVIEKYIEGKELSCAITQMIGHAKALPVIEIVPKGEYFDYKSKYSTDGANEIVPANISQEISEKIQKLSEKIFDTLKLRQYARIDWILNGETPYFLEVNTLPGMTKTSLINKELAAAGVSTADFIQFLVDTASS